MICIHVSNDINQWNSREISFIEYSVVFNFEYSTFQQIIYTKTRFRVNNNPKFCQIIKILIS